MIMIMLISPHKPLNLEAPGYRSCASICSDPALRASAPGCRFASGGAADGAGDASGGAAGGAAGGVAGGAAFGCQFALMHFRAHTRFL